MILDCLYFCTGKVDSSLVQDKEQRSSEHSMKLRVQYKIEKFVDQQSYC
jgi:hypothetical protein